MADKSADKTADRQKNKQDEMILVVKRDILFKEDAFQGLQRENMHHYEDLVKNHMEFHPRSLMEQDSNFKQIIPYLIFRHQDRYFLMQRKSNASEIRLQNKYSLGIGGHIRKEDITDGSLITWAHREFHEEINYRGALDIKPFGILNDDSNAVGQVHLGFVFLLIGDSDRICVKSELKSGTLKKREECQEVYDHLESWSKIVLDAL